MGAETPEVNRKTVENATVMPDVKEGEKKSAIAMAGLQRVEGLSRETNKSPEAAKNEVPSLGAQLNVIVQLGKKMYEVETDPRKKIEMWNTYIKCVDKFRQASAGLPPLNKVDSVTATEISTALQRGNITKLLEVFAREQQYRALPVWRKIPGLKFVGNFLKTGKELGGGFVALAELGTAKISPWASPEEKAKAGEVLKAVWHELTDINNLTTSFFRTKEYDDLMAQEGRADTEEMAGRHAFDAAIMLAGTGTIVKALSTASKGAAEIAVKTVTKTVTKTAGKITEETAKAASVAEGAALRVGGAVAAAEITAIETGAVALESSAAGGIKHILKHGAKEIGENMGIETSKITGHKTHEVEAETESPHIKTVNI